MHERRRKKQLEGGSQQDKETFSPFSMFIYQHPGLFLALFLFLHPLCFPGNVSMGDAGTFHEFESYISGHNLKYESLINCT